MIFPDQRPGTVPLKLFSHPSTRDNYTTASAEGERDATRGGYRFVRVEGYIYATPQPGTVAIKTFYSEPRYDHAVVTPRAESDARGWGYKEVRVEGYAFPHIS